MKSKVNRILVALFMTVTLLLQVIPFQAITAHAETINSTEVSKSEGKQPTTASSSEQKNDSINGHEITEGTEESTTDDALEEPISNNEAVEDTKKSNDNEKLSKEDVDLDSSIYGAGAGVPGESFLRMMPFALSQDLPTFFGINTDAIVKELSAHEKDGFYIGTPYRGLYTNPDEANYLSPNGAPTGYGPGMNCTGFIATVIKRAGGDISRITNNSSGFGGAANAYNWRDVLRATTYADTFGSISEMLASGKMRKGDIIYFDPDKTVVNYDSHIGFFWGNSPSENKFWHSYDPGGNMISEIKAKSPAEKIYVFHNAEPPKEGKLFLKKVDDTGKTIAGAEFDLIANGKTTKATTNDSGELVTPNYNVGTVVEYKETKAPAGHYIDPATSKGSVALKEGTNTIKVTNPRFANLTLVKTNDKGQKIEGAKFVLSYDGKTHEAVSDGEGRLFAKGLKAGTKVDWEEIATVKGHYIDPEKSKGSIVVKSGENTINVNNPTLNFGIDSQASNTAGQQFINPSKGQKLVDQVLIEAHQAPDNVQLRLTTDFVEFGTGKQLGKESLKQVTEFEAKQAKFVKAINLDFGATNMHGKKGVFTNVLEYFNPSTKEWEEVARHDDLKNETEAIQIVKPEIHTELFFYDQNNKETKLTDPLKKVKGYDRVFFKNLIAGETYVFDLAMMNRETGKEFTDPSGKPVTGTLTVVAGKDGKVTSKINAKEYYENLAKGATDKDVKKDTDASDSETTDSKEEDGTKESSEAKETDVEKKDSENVEDEVKETEEPTAYTPLVEVELLTGYVDVPFETNLSAAKGKIMVAYEKLSHNDTPIAHEKDIKNEKQTGKVRNPKIGTKALVNGKTEVTTDGKVTLTDEVAFEDLTPGVEYEQKVTWMDKRSKKPVLIDGKELTSTIKFTPKESTGTVTVTIDDIAVQQLFGKDSKVELVAFEETTSKGEPIASEKDFENKGQTITIKKPVTPATPTSSKTVGTLPQTSGELGNPFVWVTLVLAVAAVAIFVFMKKKHQEQ